MKLIFINSLPTSIIFGNKVDAWWYQNNGFDVEFWDASSLYYTAEELDTYYRGSDEYKYIGPNHLVISNIDDFYRLVDNVCANTFFFDLSSTLLGYIGDGAIPRYLKKRNMKLAYHKFSCDRDAYIGKVYVTSLLRMIKRKIDGKVVLPDIYFGVGMKTRKFVNKYFPTVKFISLPAMNVQWEKSERKINFNYCVFIDESIEYDPDANMVGRVLCDDLDGYYSRMNGLFELIEKELNIKIIIAASGKYIYPADRYNGREIIYGETFDLMDHADLILGHTSRALEHNVKNKLPMLLINDKSFSKYKMNGFKSLSISTGNKVYMSDNFKQSDLEFIMNKENSKFDKLVNDYFKEDGVGTDYKEIIAKTFLEYGNID